MKKQLKVSFLFTAMATVGFGFIYPLLLTCIGFIVPSLSRPSLLTQSTQTENQFQGRPSMGGGSYSGASNLSLTGAELQKQVDERIKRLTKDTPGAIVPHDLLFASASGYDANLSVAGAFSQIPRIAQAHNINKGILQHLVRRHTQPKLWGFIGSEKVDVIELNQALDKLMAKPLAATRLFQIEPSDLKIP